MARLPPVRRLPALLDGQLQLDADLSFYDYTVLASLSGAPERTRQMSELASMTSSSLSRLSHAASRLEQQEYLTRSRCRGAVGRATNATLTDAGLAKITAAAAYWFTSSTSSANPAVTVGRAMSDTFAGIAPASVPAFVAAQLLGALAGAWLLVLLFGRRLPPGEDVVMPHPDRLDNSHAGPDPHADMTAGPQSERSPVR